MQLGRFRSVFQYLPVALVCATACERNLDLSDGDIAINDSATLRSISVTERTVDLEQPDTALVVGIGSVDIDESGSILIADPSEGNVKEYSPSGKLLRLIGRKGAGPGEFGNARFARYSPNGRVFVVDLENGEISQFGVNREFERRFRPGTITSIGGFEVLDDSTFVLSGREGGVIADNVLFVVAADGSVNRRMLPIWSTRPANTTASTFWDAFRTFPFDILGDSAFVVSVATDSLWRVDLTTGSFAAQRLLVQGLSPIPDPPETGFRASTDFVRWVQAQYMAWTPVAMNDFLAVAFLKGGDVLSTDPIIGWRSGDGRWSIDRERVVIRARWNTAVSVQGPIDSLRIILSTLGS